MWDASIRTAIQNSYKKLHGLRLTILNNDDILQLKIPYRPVESNLTSLPTNRDKLPSGKQIIALTLTWVPICSFLIVHLFNNFTCLNFFFSV